MNGVEVLRRTKCFNLADLIGELQDVADGYTSPADISVNDGAVVVSVESQRLTDGSEVFNINIEQLSAGSLPR